MKAGARKKARSISHQHCANGPDCAMRQAGTIVIILHGDKNFRLPKNEPNEKYFC